MNTTPPASTGSANPSIPSQHRVRNSLLDPAIRLVDSASRKPMPDQVTVTATESAALNNLARLIKANPITAPDQFAVEAATLATQIPASLIQLLRNFRDNGNQLGCLIIRGLPLGGDPGWDIPSTPFDNTKAVGSQTLLARVQAILSSAVTDLISYEAEGCGFLLQDMVPNPDLVHAQQSQGSKVELEAHTEQCFSPYRPDYVSLAALRGDPNALTYVFTARQLVELLPAESIAALREPWWTTTIDESFHRFVPNPAEVRGPMPILSGHVDDPTMLIDQDLMRGINPVAENLAQQVISLYVEHRRSHALQAGDMLLLDNSRAMHGRSPFSPRFDGTDRFIIRGFCTRDLSRSAAARNLGSRQILAAHS